MGSLGWPEILVILVIALIVFGPRKLPELGKTLGQSLAQFRRASEDFKRQWEEEVETERRRLDTPTTAVAQSSYASESVEHQQNDFQYKAQSYDEPQPATTTEPPPATVHRGEDVKETKRDWM
jgi:TatA/E family protein of Tat protein translocase